jgi:hypothetical protein
MLWSMAGFTCGAIPKVMIGLTRTLSLLRSAAANAAHLGLRSDPRAGVDCDAHF